MELIDKSRLIDTGGRPYSQGLFLELGYMPYAVFTLKEQDHIHNGNTYISLKKRFIEMEDVTEYDFATKWLLNWKQWQRLSDNKTVGPHIQEWRDELEYKLRSRAAKKMIEQAEGGNFQATKWLMDRGWLNKGAGRPSKLEKDGFLAAEARIQNEYNDDIQRLKVVK